MRGVGGRQCAALVLAAAAVSTCGSGGGAATGYHPDGGVYESTHREHRTARLHPLRNTAVISLEASGMPAGDTGEEGIDELRYRFETATAIRFAVGDFAAALSMTVLDARGREVARLPHGTDPLTIVVAGDHTLRFEHPQRGDPHAAPINVFVHPARAAGSAGLRAGAAGVDVTELQVTGSCKDCDLSGIVWDACPDGVVIDAREEFVPGTVFGANVGFEGARFDTAALRCVGFRGTEDGLRFNMRGASFDDANLYQVTFDHSDHHDGSFHATTLQNSVFRFALAPGADFDGAHFFGVDDGTSVRTFAT